MQTKALSLGLMYEIRALYSADTEYVISLKQISTDDGKRIISSASLKHLH
jgi:hypothetical protein